MTGSLSPVINSAGCLSFAPSRNPVSSQVSSILRYQLSPPRKSCALELVGGTLQIRCTQPRRQLFRHAEAIENRLVAVENVTPFVGSVRFAGQRVEEAEQCSSGILAEIVFGFADLLEVFLVEDAIAEGCLGYQARTDGSSRKAGHAPQAHRGKKIRPQHRRIPGHRRAPIMAEDHRRLSAERIDEADHIAR